MARIDLINVSKQFRAERAGSGVTGSVPATAVQQAQANAAGERQQRLFAIQKLNLTIPQGKVMVILGPSGCGKSTLLQMIAGLMEPDSGEIHFDGANMADVPPGDRQIGMVFQNYALYPQYSSQRNIMSYFSFRKRTPELSKEAAEKYRRTSELMGVDLEYLLNKKPGRLSGGEQQRVAIARCITRDPQLFLLDEPFSNLDAKLREKYRVQLKRLLRAFEITTAYVTHDQREALSLADLIAIMNTGRIEQVGTPREIYNWPANIFVADFLFFETDALAINLVEGEKVSPEFEDHVIGVRPEDIHLFSSPTQFGLQGTITDIRPNPIKGSMLLSISLGNQELTVRLPVNTPYAIQLRSGCTLKSTIFSIRRAANGYGPIWNLPHRISRLMVKTHSTSNTNQLIPLETIQSRILFWGWWVLTHTVTVAGVTAVALGVGYVPSAVTGWIGVGISLSFIQQLVLDHYTRLNYWGWATVLGWLVGVPLGKVAVGWQAAGWDLDWALLGLSVGILQALVLRQRFRSVGWWLLASSTGLILAGALGGATSLLEDWLAYKGFIHFEENLARRLGWTLAAAVGGAVYGAVTGGWLLWFLGAKGRE